MKKNKLIALATIFLALSVVGCNSNNTGGHNFASEWTTNATKHWHACTDEGCKEKSDEAAHTFVEDAAKAVAPTHVDAGKKIEVCSVCGYEKETRIAAIGHTFVDATEAQLLAAEKTNSVADCTVAGNKWQVCSCGVWQEVAIPATGHTFEQVDGVDVVNWTTQVSCTVAGVGTKHCTVCGQDVAYEEAALGHVYEQVDGADKITWTSEASCEVAGAGYKECTRCHEQVAVTTEALGHTMTLVGGEIVPEEGKAAVRMYQCSVCEKTYMGFKASEVSARSAATLVVNDQGGARFWGRPIGNDVALNENGDPDSSAHDAVFNKEQQGDFFEYVFDLTADQAAQLAVCKLYAEATAAQYMSNNRMDFWACKSGDTDWTRGMYIETTDTHTEGEDIDTYRYILYVDDVVQDFDPTISVPAKANTVKTEYVLPFTFNLHEGTNKIRLVMAGGYRSIFYNFTFRPVVA